MKMNNKFTLAAIMASTIASGCIDPSDFINIVEKEPEEEPGKVVIPEKPTEIPEQGEETKHPGGSGGIISGGQETTDEPSGNNPGKQEDPETLSIETVSPSSGDTDGGYEIRIYGKALEDSASIAFGQVSSPSQTYINKNVIRAVVPPGATGCVDVVLAQNGETVKLDKGFCYADHVMIDSVTPHVVVSGQSTPIIVNGRGMDKNSRVSLSDDAESLPLLDLSLISDKQIAGLMPTMKPGKKAISITNSSSHVIAKDVLEVLPSMDITDISPHLVKSGEAKEIAIIGHGFLPNMKVRIGNEQTNAETIDDKNAKFTVPPMAAGSYDILLYDDWRQFRYENALHIVNNDTEAGILGIYPDFGPTRGNTAIQIIGNQLALSGDALFGSNKAVVSSYGANLWKVQTPPGNAGKVDVSASQTLLSKAFEYIVYPTGKSIVPDYGRPGDAVLLTGTGFDKDLRVFFDDYEVTEISVQSSTQASLKVPSGVGKASVRLEKGRAKAATSLTFTYTQALELTGLSSNEASIAGGTIIEIYGGIFDDSLILTVDGKELEYTVESSNCLRFEAPSHDIGKVKVVLASADGKEKVSTDLTYYDPSGINTSASGGKIDGALYVTVLTVDTAIPIPDATVYIGSDLETSLKGTTDANGRVTFTDVSLKGSQIIIACAPEHSCNTLQPVNARNITLFLEDWRANDIVTTEPTPPPSPEDSGTFNPIDVVVEYTPKPAYFTGTVGDFGKIELESNPNHVRAGLVMQSSLSIYPVPYDKDDVYFLKEPGAKYKIKARKGDVALALVCGIYNTETKQFIPKYLGIKRHMFVTDGAEFKNHLECPLPLNQTQSIKMLNAPLNSGPNEVNANAHIMVGDEGYIGGFMSGASKTDLVVLTKLPPLRDELSEANFAITVGAYTKGGYPASVFYEYNVIPSEETLEVGPAAPIPIFRTQTSEDILKTGKLAWSVEYPQNVDFYAMAIRMYSSENNGDLLYQLYLPGTATTAEFPTLYSWPEDKTGQIYVQLIAYKSVRKGFDFNLFSTADLRYNYIHSSASATLLFHNPASKQPNTQETP